MSRSGRFTAEEDAIIKSGAASGALDVELGAKLGRKVQAIRDRRHFLGLAVKYARWTPERDALFRQMYESGASYPQMMEALGVTRKTLQRRRAALQLSRVELRRGGPPGPRSFDKRRILARLAQYDEPVSWRELRKGLRLHTSGVKALSKLCHSGLVVKSGPRTDRRYILPEKLKGNHSASGE